MQEFTGVTGNEKLIHEVLVSAKWNVENAMEIWFT